jgi:hypothetical protein
VNPYAKAYTMMRDEEAKQISKYTARNEPVPVIKLLFKNLNPLNRRYNLPYQNEVAAVYIPDADDNPPVSHIVVHQKGWALKSLPNIDPNVDSMIYPLFFPRGYTGWYLEH